MDFYMILSRYYDDLFPPNQKQIRFLMEHSPVQGKILDVGAGTGAYAAALAAKGAVVEALEIGSMVPYLMKTAEKKGFTALEMGMEQIHVLKTDSYGLITCIGNTLVHLESTNQVTAFLQKCKQLLLPGGQLIIQIVNYDRIIAKSQTELPVITVPDQQLTLNRSYVIGEESVQFITKLNAGEMQWVSETRLLALRQQDLAQCLKAAGFEAFYFYGDFEGAAWELSSPATVAVANS